MIIYRFAAIVALGLTLSACAETIPIGYSPSSTLTASGEVQVDDFKYYPAITGKMKPNQLRNTAMGAVLFDKNVDVFFRDAVFTELRFVGIKVGSGGKRLSGDIHEFLIDDLGYSVDWTVDVTYSVKDASGSVLYNSQKVTKNRTSKFSNVFQALNQQMKDNVEALIKDTDFLKAIN